MRQHLLFCIQSSSPAPAGYGDSVSWLNYYKLNPDAGETYVAYPAGTNVPTKEGDILWFGVDGTIVAYTTVLRMVEDAGRPEVWYDAGKISRPAVAILVQDEKVILLDGNTGESWLRLYGT